MTYNICKHLISKLECLINTTTFKMTTRQKRACLSNPTLLTEAWWRTCKRRRCGFPDATRCFSRMTKESNKLLIVNRKSSINSTANLSLDTLDLRIKPPINRHRARCINYPETWPASTRKWAANMDNDGALGRQLLHDLRFRVRRRHLGCMLGRTAAAMEV